MSRSLIGISRLVFVVVSVLALGFGASLLREYRPHRTAVAQDAVRLDDFSQAEPLRPGGRAKRSRDPFAVPNVRETSVLVEFVLTLKALEPENEEGLVEYEARAVPAIRRACERILSLDKNEASEAHRFARSELVSLTLQDLMKADKTTVEERTRFAEEVVLAMKRSARTADDVEQAISFVTDFESLAPSAEATTLAGNLAPLFTASRDPEVALRGKFLEGAARRLGSVGEVFELTGTTVGGAEFDIQSLRGKIVLVKFWASWCQHCLDEMPRLKGLRRGHKDQGFEIVGVSADDEHKELEDYLKKQRLPWPTLHDREAGAEHPAIRHYGIGAYPTTFLLDREGRVLAMELRGRRLATKLRELLGPPAEPDANSFPVFSATDLIDHLVTAGSELYAADKTKSDAVLRRNLDRTQTELTLPDTPQKVIGDQDLYRDTRDSLFVVCSLYKQKSGGLAGRDNDEEWETSLATAFAITADGVLSTSCHVFDNEDDADAVIVMDSKRNVYPVQEILAANRDTDTALFRIDAKDLKPLVLATGAVPGSTVRVMGHPGDSFYFLSAGHVANYERDSDGTLWMNVTADFGQGSSGGPALDSFGHVIGQVSRTYTLYATGPARRGTPRFPLVKRWHGTNKSLRQAAIPPTRIQKLAQQSRPLHDDGSSPERKKSHKEPPPEISDPQMVFKSCVPVRELRSLVKPAPSNDGQNKKEQEGPVKKEAVKDSSVQDSQP